MGYSSHTTTLLAFLLLANSWEASHGLLRGKKSDDLKNTSPQHQILKSGSSNKRRQLQPATMDRLVTGRGGSAYGTMDSVTPLLSQCESPCATEYDCRSGLICFSRSQSFQAAPGCANAASDSSTSNYCVDPSDSLSGGGGNTGSLTAAPVMPPLTRAPTPRSTLTPTPRPTLTPTPRPTLTPTPQPTPGPTTPQPTQAPTASPTPAPTPQPTIPAPSTQAPTPTSVGRDALDTIIATLETRLLPVALEEGNEFLSDITYQSKAIARMAEIIGITTATDAKITQFYVLYCIYEATNGVSNFVIETDPRFNGLTELPAWISSNGWSKDSSNDKTLSGSDPCSGSWFGITCDSADRIFSIKLANNRLSGHFPPEVVLLASDGPSSVAGAGNLNRIDLFQNIFLMNLDKGVDTYWWWTSMGSNFEYLLFGQTAFGDSLGKLPQNLIEFDCSYTLINGGLSDDIFEGLLRLKYAVLDGNFFDAPIPRVLGQLPELEFLYAADSAITGDLLYMDEGMPSIIEHWVDMNPAIDGSIPPSIGALTTLESMSLTGNTLTGFLPTQLGRLTNLRQLWLYDNDLSGPIPSELGNLRRLSTLQLESNNLEGAMPDEVCANYDGGVFRPLDVVGADCSSGVQCDCCTCCSYIQCNL